MALVTAEAVAKEEDAIVVLERERDKRVTEKNLANVISNNYFLEREKREERGERKCACVLGSPSELSGRSGALPPSHCVWVDETKANES